MLHRVALVSAAHQRAPAVGVQGPALHPGLWPSRGRAPPALSLLGAGAGHVFRAPVSFHPTSPSAPASMGLVSSALETII